MSHLNFSICNHSVIKASGHQILIQKMKNIYHYHYFTQKASNNEKFNNNVLKIKLSITNCGTDILKLSHTFLLSVHPQYYFLYITIKVKYFNKVNIVAPEDSLLVLKLIWNLNLVGDYMFALHCRCSCSEWIGRINKGCYISQGRSAWYGQY